jgi:hypothetical protein
MRINLTLAMSEKWEQIYRSFEYAAIQTLN